MGPIRYARALARRYLDHRLARRGIRIAPGCRIARSVVLDTALGGRVVIGPGCQIGHGCYLCPNGGEIVLGAEVYLGPYCVLYGHGGLAVGDRTMIAAHAVLIPANHRTAGVGPMTTQPLSAVGIRVGADCWLGAGVRVLDGVAIGDGAVVGAGGVVTRSIPPLQIAVGVPARVVRGRTGAAADLPAAPTGRAT